METSGFSGMPPYGNSNGLGGWLGGMFSQGGNEFAQLLQALSQGFGQGPQGPPPLLSAPTGGSGMNPANNAGTAGTFNPSPQGGAPSTSGVSGSANRGVNKLVSNAQPKPQGQGGSNTMGAARDPRMAQLAQDPGTHNARQAIRQQYAGSQAPGTGSLPTLPSVGPVGPIPPVPQPRPQRPGPVGIQPVEPGPVGLPVMPDPGPGPRRPGPVNFGPELSGLGLVGQMPPSPVTTGRSRADHANMLQLAGALRGGMNPGNNYGPAMTHVNRFLQAPMFNPNRGGG